MGMLLDKLVSWVSRAFDRSPDQVLALRVQSTDGNLVWEIDQGILTTTCLDGSGPTLSVALDTMTIGQLGAYFAAQIGYAVPYVTTNTALANLSALVLLDGTGTQDTTNGDHLYAYTNELYAIMDAYASELTSARQAIQAMPLEMSTTTADGIWLDYLGSYYDVPRNTGEVDAAYGLRIVAQTLLPKGNNVAIAMAIQYALGQPVTVIDVQNVLPSQPDFSGVASFDGTYDYNPMSQIQYNLFDVQVGFDILNSTSPTAFSAQVTTLVNKLRDAGNYLRTLSLAASAISDTAPRAVDEPASLTIASATYFDGTFIMDGTATFAGATSATETLA